MATIRGSGEAVGEPTGANRAALVTPTAGSVDVGAPTVTSAGTAGPDACTRVMPPDEGGVEVTGVGDSIMLSASVALETVFDGAIVIDAEEGRQFGASMRPSSGYARTGVGTGGCRPSGDERRFSAENFDDLMAR